MPAFRPIVYPPPSIADQQAAVSLARRSAGVPIARVPLVLSHIPAPAMSGIPVRGGLGGGPFTPTSNDKFR